MTDNSKEMELPHCKHFVTRKKRYCRMTIKPGQEYCGEHMVPSAKDEKASDSLLRIVCPLDPKHTCYANKLAKHLKICNARQKESLPYIVKGINYGIDPVVSIESERIMTRLLSNVPVDQIKCVVKKVNSIFAKYIENNIFAKESKHPIVEEELLKPEYGQKTQKHLIQASSLLGLLNDYNLLQPETCYIDFGAGKGHLSYWISKSIENLEKSSVLLVERAAHRHKADNKLDKSNGRVHRIRADIADLVLDKVEIVQKSKQILGVTKHLCGEATDLALRCLTNTENVNEKVLGALFAFCCHHRCQWSTYVGKIFFKDVGLTKLDFDAMCGMVSWATCGSGVGRDLRTQESEEKLQNNLKLNDRDQEIGLNREQKSEIGKKCKYVLNWGRLHYLQTLNFKCNLHYYVDEDISPENLCIAVYK